MQPWLLDLAPSWPRVAELGKWMQNEYIGTGNLGSDAVVQKQGMVRLRMMTHRMTPLGFGKHLALERQ